MSKEEEKKIWERYAVSSDMELRNELAEFYLPLAAKIAGRFMGKGLEYDDLFQTASLALIKAIEGFQTNRGVQFSSYAVPSISGAIRNEIRDQAEMIRLPESQMVKRRNIYFEQKKFEREYNRTPTPQEIADKLQMEAADVLLLTTRSYISLDTPVSEDGMVLDEILGQEDSSFIKIEDEQWMESVLNNSNEREKQIIEFRFQQNLGQRETAKRMGISQMQVSRLERRLLAKLRRNESLYLVSNNG